MTVIGASRPSVWATTSTRIKALAPTQPDLVDAGFLVGMLVLGLVGFRTTFDSPLYLAAGILGILIGVGLSHVANVLRQPIIVIAGLVIAAYFLVGGFVGVRERMVGGVVPTPQSLSGLSAVAVGGWKDLLTTLPPVDGAGQLVVLPYLLGLLGGTVGFTLARRTRLPWSAVVTPLVVSSIVILLGTRTPAAALPIGLGTAVMAAGWVVVRARRLSLITVGGSESAGRRARLLTGAALLVVAALAATVAAPLLTGSTPRERVVLRAYVEPPFDPTSYPSPVAGFRKYTEGAKAVWDQTLLSVSGLPAGSRLRFATLDAYSGTAWGAGTASSDTTRPDTYQRVGTAIEQPSVADPQAYTVTVEAAYAAITDLNVWLPSAGPATKVEFSGGTAAAHAASLRYNLALGQGIVPDRLRTGDIVHLSGAVTPVSSSGSVIPGTGVLMDSASFAFLAPQATKWGGGQGDPWAQLMSVAKHLKLNGAYSDGTSAAEAQYLPGHGVGRLLTFANLKQPVGNDEQYAAVFALMANQLGVPARVVMGATVPEGGAVRGQDVHVWAEVLASDGTWVGVPESVFMPDRSKKPDQQEPPAAQNFDSKVVPPPPASRPPGSADSFGTADAGAEGLIDAPVDPGFVMPAWILTTARIAGPPLAVVLASCAVIVLAKGVRRRRRRTRGAPTARLAGGWREIVDRAADLGAPVAAAATRREQGIGLSVLGVRDLADDADAGVFGPGEPSDADVADYWSRVDGARRAMATAYPRWKRWRAAVSLRSLLGARPLRKVAA
jgi:hypothetical protein